MAFNWLDRVVVTHGEDTGEEAFVIGIKDYGLILQNISTNEVFELQADYVTIVHKSEAEFPPNMIQTSEGE